MKMKKSMLFGLVALALTAVAQADSPYYYPGRDIPYGGDPFKFCSEGMPSDGWIPLSPAAGTWTPISQYVNYHYIPLYETMCPHSHGKRDYGTG
jgi:hypothetical protein